MYLINYGYLAAPYGRMGSSVTAYLEETYAGKGS